MIIKSNKKEPTNYEILETMNEFATHVEKRFQGVDKRFEGIDKRLDKIESTMVTKDYLDEKLSDLRGDLVVLMRKEDRKLVSLVKILLSRNIITKEDVQRILAMEPFSKTNS